MEKNILSEIDQMKYLFGYKPGKVISEQSVPAVMTKASTSTLEKSQGNSSVEAKLIWDEIKDSIEGLGTNLPKLKKACGKITSKQIYDQLLTLVKNEEKVNLVMDYIMDDFSTMFDEPQYTQVHAGKGGYGADGFDTSESTNTSKFCASQMSKFNSDEWQKGFFLKANTPYG